MAQKRSIVRQVRPVEFVERRIYLIRGLRVMLDGDLAELYQAAAKVLNQAVRRNIERFPADFMFQLSDKELENWRSQIVTSNPGAKMVSAGRPMHSPNMEWRCSLQFSGAGALFS